MSALEISEAVSANALPCSATDGDDCAAEVAVLQERLSNYSELTLAAAALSLANVATLVTARDADGEWTGLAHAILAATTLVFCIGGLATLVLQRLAVKRLLSRDQFSAAIGTWRGGGAARRLAVDLISASMPLTLLSAAVFAVAVEDAEDITWRHGVACAVLGLGALLLTAAIWAIRDTERAELAENHRVDGVVQAVVDNVRAKCRPRTFVSLDVYTFFLVVPSVLRPMFPRLPKPILAQ